MFIAICDEHAGQGKNLEEAYENLCDNSGYASENRDEVVFYEATEIQVEYKIVKKEVVTKVKQVKENL